MFSLRIPLHRWSVEGKTIVSNRILITISAVLALGLASGARADTVLYNDGAINGNLGSTFITFGDKAADSFVLSSATTLSGVTVGLWSPPPDNPPGTPNPPVTDNPPLILDWSIWDASGPGGIGGVVLDSGTGATLSDTFLFQQGGQGGYGIYQSSFALPSITLSAGTYWLELQNAVNPDEDAVLWDVNNGPSEAWDDQHGIITAPDCGNSAPYCRTDQLRVLVSDHRKHTVPCAGTAWLRDAIWHRPTLSGRRASSSPEYFRRICKLKHYVIAVQHATAR
jgi:hypothetical protein